MGFANRAKARTRQRTHRYDGKRYTFLARVLTDHANPYAVRVRVRSEDPDAYEEKFFFNLGWIIEQTRLGGDWDTDDLGVALKAAKAKFEAQMEQAKEKKEGSDGASAEEPERANEFTDAEGNPTCCTYCNRVTRNDALKPGGREGKPMCPSCREREPKERYSAEAVDALREDNRYCECMHHRYHVVHVYKNGIHSHSQSSFEALNRLAGEDTAGVTTVPSELFDHDDTAEELLARYKAVQEREAQEREDGELRTLTKMTDPETFDRYCTLRKQAPSEWAVKVERKKDDEGKDRYQIVRCTGLDSFSHLYAGKTFEEAVQSLEMLVTGWAIGAGFRD